MDLYVSAGVPIGKLRTRVLENTNALTSSPDTTTPSPWTVACACACAYRWVGAAVGYFGAPRRRRLAVRWRRSNVFRTLACDARACSSCQSIR